MELLNELLNSEIIYEEKEFLAYLNKNNKRKDVKNVLVYKCLKTDDINQLESVFGNLKNNDSYHAVRKRLLQSLYSFLSNQTYSVKNGDYNEAMKLSVLATFLFQQGLLKNARKCLLLAEKKAKDAEFFSLLNEIYLTQLDNAHLFNDRFLSDTILKLESNRQNLVHQERLHVAYAQLRNIFSKIQLQNLVDTKKEIQNKLKEIGVDFQDVLTFKSLRKILYIANEFANIQQDYSLIAPFINRAKEFILSRNNSADLHVHDYLHILYFLSNYNFRIGEFEKSFEYVEEMRLLMENHLKETSDFKWKYSLISGLVNFFRGDCTTGLNDIKKALNHKQITNKEIEYNDLMLAYVFMLAQKMDKSSLKYMAHLNRTEKWYEDKMGMKWAIQKMLIEILMRAQFDDLEFAVYRLSIFKKRYIGFLKKTNEESVIQYIKILEKYLNQSMFTNKYMYIDELDQLYLKIVDKDVFVKSFFEWLSNRLRNTK